MPIPACIGRITGVPIGTRVMLSTPAAMTTSWVPLITACAAKWSACCDEPHWRSMVTAGTLSGSDEASTMLRPMWKLCSPTWLTQPTMTSSIAAGSMPERADEGVEYLRAHVGRMPAAQRAAALAARGAQRFDDIGFGHGDLLRPAP